MTISTSKPINTGVIQLVDQNGKVVLQKDIEGTSNKFVLQTAQLSNGIYSVFVGGENEFAQPMKVVVMH